MFATLCDILAYNILRRFEIDYENISFNPSITI